MHPTKSDFSYQEPLVAACVSAILRGEKEVLLAACPGAGKTVMAFDVVRRLRAAGWLRSKALALAWNRTDLQAQWEAQLAEHAPELRPLIDITIPQVYGRLHDQHDLLVVDEAHYVYDTDNEGQVGGDPLIGRVVKITKPRATLLLTGSPSKFIARGLKPTAVFAVKDLADHGRAAPLMTEVGTSAYDITAQDYTENLDVVPSFPYSPEQTEVTLDRLLRTLETRLRLGPRALTGPLGAWNRVNLQGWNVVLSGLKKTLLVCSNIRQADQVASYFLKRQIPCLVSHSKNDPKSKIVGEFAASPVPILVVAQRARLGYDNTELFNLIDLSGTRNLDLIFQMLCRVVRPSKVDPRAEKLFIKLVPHTFSASFGVVLMEACLNLVHREVFEAYDGNFATASLPRKPLREGFEPRAEGRARPKGAAFWDAVWHPRMTLQGFMSAVKHHNDPHGAYEATAQTRLGDVLGLTVREPAVHKQRILAFVKTEQRRPSQTATDADERRLAKLAASYTCKTHGAYDPEFATALFAALPEAARPGAAVRAAKAKILAFATAQGRRPSKNSGDAEERRLAQLCAGYVGPSQSAYDAAFAAQLAAVAPPAGAGAVAANQAAVLAFAARHGAKPSHRSADPEERRLAKAAARYLGRRQRAHDPSFAAELEGVLRDRGWRPRAEGAAAHKAEVLAFAARHRRRPGAASPDAAERQLAKLCTNYTSPSNNAYDPGFTRALAAVLAGDTAQVRWLSPQQA